MKPYDQPVVSWRDDAQRLLAQLGVVALTVVLVLAFVALQGCSSQLPQAPAPKPEVVIVEKVIAEPCVESAPIKPVYRWGAGSAKRTMSDREAVVLLSAELDKAKQYGVDWEAATVGCVKAAAEVAKSVSN